jgi:hypothetical protein
MATIQNHSKTIDGITYTTRTLPASKGLVILPKLTGLFGEALMGLFFATDEEDREELLQNPQVIAAAITTIAEKAAASDGLLVIRDLLTSTEADLVRVGEAEVPGSVFTHFDGHFSGRYRHLVEVAFWVGSVNFAGP